MSAKVKKFDFLMFAVSAMLSIATFVLNLLLTSSLAFLFSSSNSENTERILTSLKVNDVDVTTAFAFHSKVFDLLASWKSVLVIFASILVLVTLWGIFYKISGYYASKAVGVYSRITCVMSIIIAVLAIFAEPVISYYFEDFSEANDTKLKSFCAVMIIACLIMIVVGILASICSLLLSTAEGAPRKKLIDDDLLQDSISARDVIERKKEKEKVEKESSKKPKKKERKKPRAITVTEIIPHEEDEEQKEDRYCKSCGAKLKANALFCGQCGKRI
ncbi:MAG: zinc ribbon domain-containing protein [Ruminococcus sp.]|nr:zinc ribbon domain-containing protein [Ruminococcus sp.]